MQNKLLLLFLLIISCNTKDGHLSVSNDIKESMKREIFMQEYIVSPNPFRINDSLSITVHEAWLEQQWFRQRNGGAWATYNFQLCINTEENDLMGLDFDWTIGVDKSALRKSSKNSLIADFKYMPHDTIEYKVQKGNNLNSTCKKEIIGIFILIKK